MTNTYTANLLNQYTVITNLVTGFNPVHDADGNMITNGVWSFTWDAENRMTSACSNGLLLITNRYDDQSRRIAKAVFEITQSGTNAIRQFSFVYDGWNPIRETVSSGQSAVTQYYCWGTDLSGTLQGAGGVGGLQAVIVDGETPATYYPCYDANGNITAYVDELGDIRAAFSYDAFGNTITLALSNFSTLELSPFSHRFSTKYADDETGLYYYGYRFYSPELGRWVNRDPIEEMGGMNLYVMVGNAPLSEYDIQGLFGPTIHREATSRWARELGFLGEVANLIGEEDDGVDVARSAFPPFTEANWGWHFNRSIGTDSRWVHASEQFTAAKRFCSGAGNDDARSAAINLGIGLHPLQDWVAHGDFNRLAEMPNIIQIQSRATGLKYAHNRFGSRIPSESVINQVDDENLDADGPSGRATRNVLVLRKRVEGNLIFSTVFHAGNARLSLTRERTKEYLTEFAIYVRKHGKPCGECQRMFLGQNRP